MAAAEELQRLAAAVDGAVSRLLGRELGGRQGGQIFHQVVARRREVFMHLTARLAHQLPAGEADGNGGRRSLATSAVTAVPAEQVRASHERFHRGVRGQGVHRLQSRSTVRVISAEVRDLAIADGAAEDLVSRGGGVRGASGGEEALATQHVRAGYNFGVLELVAADGASCVVVATGGKTRGCCYSGHGHEAFSVG